MKDAHHLRYPVILIPTCRDQDPSSPLTPPDNGTFKIHRFSMNFSEEPKKSVPFFSHKHKNPQRAGFRVYNDPVIVR
jgi:hypothetical protein